MRKTLQELGRSSGETRTSIFPVGDIPELVNVIGSDIFVLKVVSVLPNIDSNNWDKTSSSLGELRDQVV